jgi:two-component system response regulator YesN
MEQLSRRLDELVADAAGATGGNEDGLRRIFIELTVLIVHIASDIGVNVDEILEYKDPYRTIMQMNNIGELIIWFKKLCEEMITMIVDKKGKRTNRIITISKDFINENYSDKNLSLSSISEHVGFSTVYFSQLFHAETGVRLSEYINNVRIDRAKDLLKNTTQKIYEIAYATGYNNPKYFNFVFKKKTGVSPNDYRHSS